MTLSELINFRNELNLWAAKEVQAEADIKLNVVTHIVETGLPHTDYSAVLKQKQQAIAESYASYQATVDELLADVAGQISEAEKPWFQESYRLYEEEMCHETAEYILNRRPQNSNDAVNIFKTRLHLYNNWQYPGMLIRPGREEFINALVGCDPLYLVDQQHELLAPALTQFNDQYKNRLRPYVIKESLTEDMLAKIPDNQFGVVFVYNFFNFRPFEVIKKYLSEIYTKLRPGGTLIMTYNDCDRVSAIQLVERHFACYTPGYLVKELARTIGYEEVYSWSDAGPSTWLEIKKPGQITTLRGGQTLAKISVK